MLLTVDEKDAYDYEDVTVDGTAGGVALSAAKVFKIGGQARAALITCETADIRYRYDGGAPTSSVGHLLVAGDSITINGPGNISNFRAIRTAGVSATIRVTYHR